MIAALALFAWPVVAIFLFLKQRPAAALSVTIIAGYLLLPTKTSFNLPLLPPLNKDTVPSFIALVMLLAVAGRRDPATTPAGWIPRGGLARSCLGLIVVGAFITVWLNPDQLVYGPG